MLVCLASLQSHSYCTSSWAVYISWLFRPHTCPCDTLLKSMSSVQQAFAYSWHGHSHLTFLAGAVVASRGLCMYPSHTHHHHSSLVDPQGPGTALFFIHNHPYTHKHTHTYIHTHTLSVNVTIYRRGVQLYKCISCFILWLIICLLHQLDKK